MTYQPHQSEDVSLKTAMVSVGWRAVLRSKATGAVRMSSRIVRERKDAEAITKQWGEYSALCTDIEELFALPSPTAVKQ